MTGKNSIKTNLIAPCGMNCGICIGHLRDKRKCPGCNIESKNKPPHCNNCSIAKCEYLLKSKSKYCFGCGKFPCKRLKDLDKRYRTKYGMSMIDNLNSIKEIGIRRFVKNESARWTCPECGNLLCVHRTNCIYCGAKKI